MRADLVEDALLEWVKAVEGARSSKAFGHEVAREVELLVGLQHVIELPLGAE